MITQQTLIVGANSEIAKALACEILKQQNCGLLLLSRHFDEQWQHERTPEQLQRIKLISVEDYSESSIEHSIDKINSNSQLPITRVFICNGLLHNKTVKPEKRLEDFDAGAFHQVMSANVLTPMLWLQKLTPILTGEVKCKMVLLSARVGSISDNRLGGWYSYRASKAALNMMVKTASIELARRAKNIKLILFHPGTTDSPLSKPFQANVPQNKLFRPEFVATQLLSILDKQEVDGFASYLDWQGESINW